MTETPEIIRRPNVLRAKVGNGFSGIDAAAVARAEEALKALSSQFDQWLKDEIAKLEAAQALIRTEGFNEATAEALYFRAHDLKGLGTTYEYPIVTRLAGSLCRLLDSAERRQSSPWPLVDAHIEAIRAVVRDKIQSDDHPVGGQLCTELEAKVAQVQG